MLYNIMYVIDHNFYIKLPVFLFSAQYFYLFFPVFLSIDFISKHCPSVFFICLIIDSPCILYSTKVYFFKLSLSVSTHYDWGKISSLEKWQPPMRHMRCLIGYTISKWLYLTPAAGEKQNQFYIVQLILIWLELDTSNFNIIITLFTL